MTRSRKRKLRRIRAALLGMPLASTMLAGPSTALGQDQADSGRLEEVLVTAQKREESLQSVPLAVTALSTKTLEDLHIANFGDYLQLLPSVSFTPLGAAGPGGGYGQVYMRGVASGGDGNHSASLPSVGIYLDEQPITTISGALDVHIYDIARVEALAGPQGTLYGASSQSGTLRIITNKPDPSGFSAAYDLQGTTVKGDAGWLAEGYVNLPVSDTSAIRLVGWSRRDPGFIDNVRTTRVFPTSGGVQDTGGLAEDNYNSVDTYGARAALRVDLNDNWTMTPAVMAQQQKTHGNFAVLESVGDLARSHEFPDTGEDRWAQLALTIEGKAANLDLVYAGSYLRRDVDTQLDYSDYAFFYDQCCGYGVYWYDDAGVPLDNPSQYINGEDAFSKISHEFRIATPADQRVRLVGGLFWQRQVHDIEQRYRIDGLAQILEITGWEDTLWLTQQQRVERDEAIFGELSFDITSRLTLTGGLRYFESENSLEGFFGFAPDYVFGGSLGEAACFDQEDFHDAPCRVFDKTVKENDTTEKLNLAFRFDDDRMIYATYATGYRPGGINRRGTLPPYTSDFLTSYELGWKTTWANNRLRFNGAVFKQEWEDFQFPILGAQGLTEINNAAQAEIDGVEAELAWRATEQLTLTGGVAFLDSELSENFCGFVNAAGDPETVCPESAPGAGDGPEAPEGTELPIAPKFKGNVTVRYEFPLANFQAHVQGAAVHQGERLADLRLVEREILGRMPSYTIADFSFGISSDRWSAEIYVDNAFDERAQLARFAQCVETVCGAGTDLNGNPYLGNIYVTTNQPRTFGIKFGQRF